MFQSRKAIAALQTHVHDKRWSGWVVLVGIEVHAQIKSRRKLFSDSLASLPNEQVNTHVSPFDAAFPGTLPRLNPKCVQLAVRTAIALGAHVQPTSSFDRKHYFYADLPAGYQITQHYSPIAVGGQLTLSHKGTPKSVRIKQIQLEQDTAKSTFDAQRRISYIDLNRAGTGLLEIVSEPDMRSPEEAGEYIRTLQAILRAVGSSDGNMEQGSLRCDVNVSVNKFGEPPGTRCEIKNLNSIKAVTVAIASEVFRHIALLQSGRSVAQETRGFDQQKAETFKLRSKEDAPDYRYMPDPNLPPLLLTKDYVENIHENMPELPDATRLRLQQKYGLSTRDITVLMTVDSGREVGYDGEVGGGAVAYFDQLCASGKRDPKIVVNWLTHQLLGQLSARKETFTDNPLTVAQMGELIDLVQSGRMTGTSGKALLRHMLDERSTSLPSKIAEQMKFYAMSSGTSHEGLSLSSPSPELESLCVEAMSALPEEVEAMRRGSKNVVNKLVGRVMKNSRGRADAMTVRTWLEKMILG